MKLVTLMLLTAVLAVATAALDSAYADSPPRLLVPGLASPPGTENAAVVLTVCGTPVATVEPGADGTVLWVGLAMALRLQALAVERPEEIARHLELSGVYQGRDWGCGAAAPVTPKPKAPEVSA